MSQRTALSIPPWTQAAVTVGTFALLFAFWQLFSQRSSSAQLFLPAPTAIVAALNRPGPNASRVLAELPNDIALTLSQVAVGLALGFGSGVPTGLLMARSAAFRAMLDPYLAGLNALPRIALLPLLIIAFGFGPAPGLVLVWSAAYVAIALNTLAGASAVEQRYLDHARVLGASRLQLEALVTLPAILPWLLSALRLGLGYAFTTAILAETAGVHSGLGYLLVWYAGQAFAPGEFLVVVVVTVLALLLDSGVVWAARRFGGGQRISGGPQYDR